jgi:hypothetical protein
MGLFNKKDKDDKNPKDNNNPNIDPKNLEEIEKLISLAFANVEKNNDNKTNEENKSKKDKKLEEKIKELETKLSNYELENNILKEEVKKLKKLLKLKQLVRNMDKKVIVVFDPVEVYNNVLKNEDPLIVEAIVKRLLDLEKEKVKKYFEELWNFFRLITPKLVTVAILGAIIVVILGFAYKMFTSKPTIVTKEKIVVIPEKEFEAKYLKLYQNATVVHNEKENNNKNQQNPFSNSIATKVIPIEKIDNKNSSK